MEGWIRVSVATAKRQAVAAALFAAGASAIQEDSAELIAVVRDAAEAERIAAAVRATDAAADVRATNIPEVDWTQEWKRGLRVRRVGRFAVAPPWLAEGLDPRETILIDPGMAFGTGDHASTRGALAQLSRAVRPGDRVADLGAGSAVLSIGAAKLGAARVTAIEIDADAIGNAEENILRNDVADRVAILHGDARAMLLLIAPVEIIAANIISGVVLDLLPAMDQALTKDGLAVIAGILDSEQPAVLDRLGHEGWRVLNHDVEEGWWSGTISRA